MKNNTHTICNIGIADGISMINYKPVKSYQVWANMISRCYDPKSLERQPTYKGCSVCKEWLKYSTFKVWFDLNYVEGYHLDKDILIFNNKEYSPNACRFVPMEINSLILDSRKLRGKLPQGVCYVKNRNKYVVNMCMYGKQKHIGTYDKLTDAANEYVRVKLNHISEVANRYYMDGKIPLDIRNSLLKWKLK